MAGMAQKLKVSSRMRAEVLEQVDELAARMGITRSEVIERCVIRGLPDGQRLATVLETPLVGRLFMKLASINPEDAEQAALFKRIEDALGRQLRLEASPDAT